MSELSQTKSIYKQLIDFQSKIAVITKEATNPFYKSKYASLSSIQQAIKQPLIESKLFYYQSPETDGLRTVIFSEEGEKIENYYPYSLIGMKPQEIGSMVTYAKRYALTAMLAIITDDEDDDGNSLEGFKYVDTKEIILTEAKMQELLTTFDIKKVEACLLTTTINGRKLKLTDEQRKSLEEKKKQLIK